MLEILRRKQAEASKDQDLKINETDFFEYVSKILIYFYIYE